MDIINYFKKHVKNSNLIIEADGILPIKGSHIGRVIINKKGKTALIEIKQCAEPHAIAYFEGHLLCSNIEYKLTETNINGGVLNLSRDNTNWDRHELQINNNRQSIIIYCSQLELVDFKQINKPMDEYKDLYVGGLYGKYFNIIENE